MVYASRRLVRAAARRPLPRRRPVAAAVVEEGLGVTYRSSPSSRTHGQGFGSMIFAALLAHAPEAWSTSSRSLPTAPPRWCCPRLGLSTTSRTRCDRAASLRRTAMTTCPWVPPCRKSRKARAPPSSPRRHRGGDGTQPCATGRAQLQQPAHLGTLGAPAPSSPRPSPFPTTLPSTAVLGRDARQEQRVHRRQAAGRQPGRPVNVGQLRQEGGQCTPEVRRHEQLPTPVRTTRCASSTPAAIAA